MSDLRERLMALANSWDDRRMRELALAAARMAQDDCIEIVREHLVRNDQRALSWHEIQDCIEAIYARADTVK